VRLDEAPRVDRRTRPPSLDGLLRKRVSLDAGCCAELDRKPGTCPIVDWQDALHPRGGTGRPLPEWRSEKALLPPGGGLPGDPGRSPQRWTITDYVLRSLSLIGALLERVAARGTSPGQGDQGGQGPLDGSPATIMGNMLRLALQLGPLASLAVVIEATQLL
jgi:hypothetical protein